MSETDNNKNIDEFIARWAESGGSERANYQLFLAQLCDLLGVGQPDPAKPDNLENAYVFERSIRFTNSDGQQTTNYIDLYKRGCFVCETKQGVESTGGKDMLSMAQEEAARYLKQGHGKRGTVAWDKMMKKARHQGERYIRALPAAEGRPPFLLVVDVGYVIEVYAEFTRTGGNYTPYPDVRSHRIRLEDLRDEKIRQRLGAIWNDPMSLDPARLSAAITREIAGRLAKLARSLEGQGHEPQAVAGFLMRSLFTMFSEDVGLLPERSFTTLLESLRDSPDILQPSLEALWKTMDAGGPSIQLKQKLLKFNGGLFADPAALPLNRDQLELLIESAKADWTHVEPAIFGTLLERALDPQERHKLGAHYTPREYVERLVMPTIVQPLREDWANVEAAAQQLQDKGDTAGAAATIEDFLKQLTQIRVLDPACGSGNFLYVTLEHLKRLEGEVLDALHGLGATQASFEMSGVTVDPHQLLGLEINPRAVAIADIVLWIGYLQWHFRTHGNVQPPEPVLRNFHNIQHRDALMEWDAVEPVLDEDGNPVTHWDGRTTKTHPVTGKEVPDETARLPEQRYINPRKAEWPEADFIVGNPPFIGNKKMRKALGKGYTAALREAYSDLPKSCDFVMYWWEKAAGLVRSGNIRRFGFITTNSIRQTFNRRIIDPHLTGRNQLSILWAIPDHPWVNSSDGAAVRISMTVAERGKVNGQLKTLVQENVGQADAKEIQFEDRIGKIHSDLKAGPNVTSATSLQANKRLSGQGMKLVGDGFILNEYKESNYINYATGKPLVREYVSPGTVKDADPIRFVVDFCGLSESEAKELCTPLYQRLLDTVKPIRQQADRKTTREKWWVFAEPRKDTRKSLKGLERYLVTLESSKFRYFVSVDGDTLWDGSLFAFCVADYLYLGTLSSRTHVVWALAQGGNLGMGNDSRYSNTRCFETFPFPDASDPQKQRIRELAEQLDTHRKQRQAEHPDLTLTGMYNVLEKLRAGEALTAKDKTIHEQGLVSVLKELHDDIDAAVADAYGWPADLADEEILERLVALNAERAAEEKKGIIRWLRPEYQNPGGATADGSAGEQVEMIETPAPIATGTRQKLPKDLPARFAAVRAAIAELPDGGDIETVAACFKNANRKTIQEILETLATLGQIQKEGDGSYRL